jgi:hypothetical protein
MVIARRIGVVRPNGLSAFSIALKRCHSNSHPRSTDIGMVVILLAVPVEKLLGQISLTVEVFVHSGAGEGNACSTRPLVFNRRHPLAQVNGRRQSSRFYGALKGSCGGCGLSKFALFDFEGTKLMLILQRLCGDFQCRNTRKLGFRLIHHIR